MFMENWFIDTLYAYFQSDLLEYHNTKLTAFLFLFRLSKVRFTGLFLPGKGIFTLMTMTQQARLIT